MKQNWQNINPTNLPAFVEWDRRAKAYHLYWLSGKDRIYYRENTPTRQKMWYDFPEDHPLYEALRSPIVDGEGFNNKKYERLLKSHGEWAEPLSDTPFSSVDDAVAKYMQVAYNMSQRPVAAKIPDNYDTPISVEPLACHWLELQYFDERLQALMS